MRIIVYFKLKAGASITDYENWAKTRDIPGVNALGSINGFTIHKATGVLGSDEKPEYDYFEIIDITTIDKFVADISTAEFQTAAAPFQDYADNPKFLLTEDL